MTHRVVIIRDFCGSLAVTPWMAFAASVPSVGSMAPEFTLPRRRVQRKSEGLIAARVVLYSTPRTSLSGCTIEAHNFQARPNRKGYQQKGCRRGLASVCKTPNSHKAVLLQRKV